MKKASIKIMQAHHTIATGSLDVEEDPTDPEELKKREADPHPKPLASEMLLTIERAINSNTNFRCHIFLEEAKA